MQTPDMKEELLHFVWRTRRMDLTHLSTTLGEPVQIESFGFLNNLQGPDFSNGRIHWQGASWAGHIEMHVKSGEWYQHKHQEDPAYENVILHVVWEEDRPVFRNDGTRIPCLELKQRVDPKLVHQYQQLLQSESWIHCESHIHEVNTLVVQHWLDALVVDQWQRKASLYRSVMKENCNDWQQLIYGQILQAYGIPHNKLACQQLSLSLPLSVAEKYVGQLDTMEALFLGQAGFLTSKDEADEYTLALQKIYTHLKAKHQLTPLSLGAWKFGGIRPPSFPTVRLLQFATLFAEKGRFYDALIEHEDLKSWRNFFKVPVAEYWTKHIRPSVPGEVKNRFPGDGFIDIILINEILPLLFFVGLERHQQDWCDRAFSLLQSMSPEKNSILQHWTDLGIKPLNAADSQALLALKKNFCSMKKCMHCAIGAQLLAQ
jgi:hypothetical protein